MGANSEAEDGMNINDYIPCKGCGDPMTLHHEQERGRCDACVEPEYVEGFGVVSPTCGSSDSDE